MKKLLYVPEGRYLKLNNNDNKDIDNYDLEKNDGINLLTNKETKTPDGYLQALFTWSKTDVFFTYNNVPYPPLRNEYIIVEV